MGMKRGGASWTRRDEEEGGKTHWTTSRKEAPDCETETGVDTEMEGKAQLPGEPIAMVKFAAMAGKEEKNGLHAQLMQTQRTARLNPSCRAQGEEEIHSSAAEK